MTNGHFRIFIDQFSLWFTLNQGHLVNALDSILVHFMDWVTPILPAFSSLPVCKSEAQLKWNTGTLKLVIEQNDTYSFTEAHMVQSL